MIQVPALKSETPGELKAFIQSIYTIVCRIFSHIEDSCFKVNGLFSATNNEPVMGLYLQQSNRIDSVRIHARQYKDSITE